MAIISAVGQGTEGIGDVIALNVVHALTMMGLQFATLLGGAIILFGVWLVSRPAYAPNEIAVASVQAETPE